MRILTLAMLFGFVSCKTTKDISPVDKSEERKFSNNRITVIAENSEIGSLGGSSKVIFNGDDNHLIIEYLNSHFISDNSNDIIIIDGNGNVIRIVYTGVTDRSVNSADTIILKGSANYVELQQKYFLDETVNKGSMTAIDFNDKYVILENNFKPIINEIADLTENKITHEFMKVNELYSYYLNETISGNSEAAFYLGEMHHMGFGLKIDVKTALKYYLISAKSGFIKAQSIVGYLYEKDFYDIGQDLDKAEYWYRLAAQGGDVFAIERLKQWIEN